MSTASSAVSTPRSIRKAASSRLELRCAVEFTCMKGSGASMKANAFGPSPDCALRTPLLLSGPALGRSPPSVLISRAPTTRSSELVRCSTSALTAGAHSPASAARRLCSPLTVARRFAFGEVGVPGLDESPLERARTMDHSREA